MSKMKLTDMLADADAKDRQTKAEQESEAQVNQVAIPAVDVASKTDNSTLKNQRYREIEPERCRPWALHNRDKSWLTPESCAELIESIKVDGQLDLGLVRPLKDDPTHDYEIIYGVRRWYSVSQLPGTKFKARATDGTDKECAKQMHVENEQSKDISAMEKGRSYRTLVENGVYASAAELAREYGLSKSYVSELLKAIEVLDYPKLNALMAPHIRDISYRDAKLLAVAMDDAKQRERVEAAAIELAQTEISEPKELMRKLLAAAKDGTVRTRKPKPSVSLFKKEKKKYAYAAEKPNGAVTITIEPGLKEAAGDDLESVVNRIVASVKKTIGVE